MRRPVLKLKRSRPWSPQEEADLRYKLIAGEMPDGIAKAFGRTADAVKLRAVKLGLSFSRNLNLRARRNGKLQRESG